VVRPVRTRSAGGALALPCHGSPYRHSLLDCGEPIVVRMRDDEIHGQFVAEQQYCRHGRHALFAVAILNLDAGTILRTCTWDWSKIVLPKARDQTVGPGCRLSSA
jgi:hypothetical protein